MSIDPAVQDEINHQNAECAAAARDARIDDATTEALTTLSETELFNCFANLEDIDSLTVKQGSPESYFQDILIYLRETANSKQARDTLPTQKLARAVYNFVWAAHRREIEIDWIDD